MTPDNQASVTEAADVRPATVAEMLAAQDGGGDTEVTSKKRLHVAIVNKDEIAEASAKRADLRAQCKAEGMTSEVDILAALDQLAPLPAVKHALLTTADGADHVLVHAGDTITGRELARFGLTTTDVEEANK